MRAKSFLTVSLLTVMFHLAVLDVAAACAIFGSVGTQGAAARFVAGGLEITGSVVDPFPIDSPMDCVCGIGFGMSGSGIPGSLAISDAELLVGGSVVAEFDFMPNLLTADGLAGGPVLLPGASWFGFSAMVSPFSLPPGTASLRFTGSIDPTDLASLEGIAIQYAAGLGSGPIPVFTGEHAVNYAATTLQVVPEPALTGLLGMAFAGALTRIVRRRIHSCWRKP